MPYFEYILDHFLVSICAALLGMTIGSFIVYLAARIIENPSFKSSTTQRYLLLIPWRTPIIGLLEFFFIPVPIMRLLGIGLGYGIASTMGQLACLVILFTPISVFRKELLRSNRLFFEGILRSIATISVALTTSAAGLSTVGLGFFIRSSVNQFHLSQAIAGWLLTILICLVIDLVAGFLQYFLWNSSSTQKDSSAN